MQNTRCVCRAHHNNLDTIAYNYQFYDKIKRAKKKLSTDWMAIAHGNIANYYHSLNLYDIDSRGYNTCCN